MIYTTRQLIDMAAKELMNDLKEGNPVNYLSFGFMVQLFPKENPYYEVILYVNGLKPVVTKCTRESIRRELYNVE